MKRLLPAILLVLAGSERLDAANPEPGGLVPQRIPLLASGNVPASGRQEVTFVPPTVPKQEEAYVFLRARMPYPRVAGYVTGALRLRLNGTALDGSRFSMRPRTSKTMGGLSETLVVSSGEASVYLSPDFEAVDRDAHYGLLGGAKACEFTYRVTDLLHPGENTLQIENQSVASPDYPRTMAIADVQLLVQSPPPPPASGRAAPSGEIPVIVPLREFPKRYVVAPAAGDRSSDPDGLRIRIGGEEFILESRFSSPDGKWNRGSSPFYEHRRRVQQKNEAILVFDTFRNLTHEDIPILQRHTCDLKDRLAKVFIAGISPVLNRGLAQDPANPSVYGCTRGAGVGLMAMNDAFQVHVTTSCNDGVLQLADNDFILKAGSTYTAEWAIVPTATNDFWTFVNAARRVRNANFLLRYQTAFLRTGPKPVGPAIWPDEWIRRFIQNKGADVVASGNDFPRFEGKAPYATSFQMVDLSVYAKHNERVKRLVPGVKTVVYYHCFLDNYPPDEERFRDARVLKPDGTQVDYGGQYRYDKVFCPTSTNAFGQETAKNIDLIFDRCGADGVYWDEMEYSVVEYHYGEPWDGVSGDVDPVSCRLIRKKSSLALLSQDFRVRQIKRIRKRGLLYANGMPYTRTIAQLQLQRFTETGTIANCAKTLLYSPVALGDHLTERTEEDAYNDMLAALDYGCLYNWYSDAIVPTHKTLASYMFPITPMELHEGWIIGKERIVTRSSGRCGWGDRSRHEVHVFNEKGIEVPDFKAPFRKTRGETLTELRLAEGWSAVIIRH